MAISQPFKKKLEPLHVLGVLRFLLGQRGNLDRMIHHKGRLDHVLLRVLLEEEIQDVALLVALLKLDAVLSRQRLGRLGVRHFVEIHARVLLDRISPW